MTTVQVTSAPHFTAPSPQCPAGAGTAPLVVDGQRAGSLRACFSSITLTTTGQLVTGRVVVGQIALALPGGRVVADVTAVETFLSPSVIEQRLAGCTVRGTGRYADAGSFTGGGLIDVEGDPNLTFVLRSGGACPA